MNEEVRIDEARALIGAGVDDDWTINPNRHPEHLAEKAPALAKILQDTRLEACARRFARADEEAVAGQRKFKLASRNASVALLATTCISALVLVVDGFPVSWGTLPDSTTLVLGLLGATTGAMSSMWMYQIRGGKLLEKWMANRARAETARLEHFEKATEPRGDVALGLLQLEYFRRYQLEVQLRYYEQRGRQHGAAAERTLGWGMVAVLLATIANAIGSTLPQIAMLGVLGAALAAFASTTEAVNQDSRNAERYGRTLDALEEARSKLSDVRRAVASGALDVMTAFVASVHDEVSLEHRQWLKQSERQGSALQQLESKINALNEPVGD